MRQREGLAVMVLAAALCAATSMMASSAQAQWGTDPEEGDTGGTTGTTATPPPPPPPASTGSTSSGSASGSWSGSTGSSSSGSSATATETETPPADATPSSVRLAIQGRLSLINVQLYGPSIGENALTLSSPAPFVTAGIRLSKVFLGIGFGFFGISISECGGTDDGCDDGPSGSEDTVSTSAFSITPLVSFDLLADPTGRGALYLVGWIPLVSGGGGSRESCTGGGSDCSSSDTDNDFWWGLNLGLGARYDIVPGVALATEWGWGFLTSSSDGGDPGPGSDSTVFGHGIWGNVVFEASIGL